MRAYFWEASRRSQFRSSAFHQCSLLSGQQVILHSFNEVIFTSTAVLNQYFFFNSLFINRNLTRSEYVKEIKHKPVLHHANADYCHFFTL